MMQEIMKFSDDLQASATRKIPEYILHYVATLLNGLIIKKCRAAKFIRADEMSSAKIVVQMSDGTSWLEYGEELLPGAIYSEFVKMTESIDGIAFEFRKCRICFKLFKNENYIAVSIGSDK